MSHQNDYLLVDFFFFYFVFGILYYFIYVSLTAGYLSIYNPSWILKIYFDFLFSKTYLSVSSEGNFDVMYELPRAFSLWMGHKVVHEQHSDDN